MLDTSPSPSPPAGLVSKPLRDPARGTGRGHRSPGGAGTSRLNLVGERAYDGQADPRRGRVDVRCRRHDFPTRPLSLGLRRRAVFGGVAVLTLAASLIAGLPTPAS